MRRRILDTNVVLHLLAGELVEAPPEGFYSVSVITELELLAFRFEAEGDKGAVESFLRSVDIVPLTETVKHEAIRIRRETRLKLPDAIVAGTALALGAELLSNDAAMARVPALETTRLAIRR